MKSMSFAPIVALALMQINLCAHATPPVWLEWAKNQESDFSHYLVYRSATPKAQPSDPADLIATLQASFYLDYEAQAGETYYYWVCSVDRLGNQSTFSGPLSVTVEFAPDGGSSGDGLPSFAVQHLDPNQDPGDPFVDRTRDNDNLIEFSWMPFQGPGIKYCLYLSENQGESTFLLESSETSFALENAESGISYKLRVDVLDSDGSLEARGYSDPVLCDSTSDEVVTPGVPTAVEVR